MTIQWICVGIILLIILVWVIRHIINMVRWSRQRNRTPHPPCCSNSTCSLDCPLNTPTNASCMSSYSSVDRSSPPAKSTHSK